MLLHAVAQNGSYTMKVSIRDVDGRSDVREGSGVATATSDRSFGERVVHMYRPDCLCYVNRVRTVVAKCICMDGGASAYIHS